MTVFYQEKNINGLRDTLTFRPLKRRTWLMLPLHKEVLIECIVPKNSNLTPHVRHENLAKLSFQVNNNHPQIIIITLKGIFFGKTFIDWHDERGSFNPRNSLIVSCKLKITLDVSFHYFRGQAAATQRIRSDLIQIVKRANEILELQANVECRIKKSIDLYYPANSNLNMGSVVGGGETRIFEYKNGRKVIHSDDRLNKFEPNESECLFMFSFGDMAADINVFFVKEYENDDTPNIDNIGAVTFILLKNTIIQDNLATQDGIRVRPNEGRKSIQTAGETLAHELGHILGLSPFKIINGEKVDTHLKDRANLMHRTGGTHLKRWQINKINRTGLRKPRS